jgi:hypothetical protein
VGYEVPANIVVLSFDKHPGLEVTAASLTMDEVLTLAEQAEALRSGQASSSSKEIRELVSAFSTRLRAWNCTRAGQPIAATEEEFRALDARFASEILLAWYDAVSGSDLDNSPLERRSTNGVPSGPVPFVPTARL